MSAENAQTSPFAFLPDDCIANIISFTSPKDACRAAAVSLGFKSAAESNVVWERFLPPDYRLIVSGSTSPVNYSTKKELYLLLCHSPLLLEGGKLSMRLSKSTGKKCYMLCARELQIALLDAPRHWAWTSLPVSRFTEVVELLNVCSLIIRGTLKAEILSPNTHYAAYLVYMLVKEHYGLDCSSKASVKLVQENGTVVEGETNIVYLAPPTHQRVVSRRRRLVRVSRTSIDVRLPMHRRQGWREIELGEFFVGEGDKSDVHVQLMETEHLDWKRGLVVEGIELRPKEGL